jgi:hypothetical protein
MTARKMKRNMVMWMVSSLGWLCPLSANAQRLTSMDEHPWLGFFSGYVQRGFEFGVGDEGQGYLFLKTEKGARVGKDRVIKIYTEVIWEMPNGSRVVKRLKKDVGLSSELEPGLKHKEVKFIAECTGDAQIEIQIKYSSKKIIMDGKILDRGTLKTGKLILCHRVVVPAMYSVTYKDEEKKQKYRMRSDKIKFVRAVDKKRVTLKSYEEVDLMDEKIAKGGITDLTVEMNGQEGKDFNFTTVGGKDVLLFTNKNPKAKGKLWEGYHVVWQREFGDDNATPLEIEVK